MDQLNDWEYCNPSNQIDRLPQPYRFINKILQRDILSELYNKIHEIEKHRSDPNYEGPLRLLPPQGIFEIPTISSISRQSSAQQVVAGDQSGNLMILDLNKKMRVCKKELGPKRILKVCLSTRDNANDDYKNVCLIAVICHLDPIVHLYRYRPGENKIFHHYTITITKNTSNIGELPINIELSLYSQYLLITQYNGSILIYRIPDLKIDQTPPQQPQVSPQNSVPKQATNFKGKVEQAAPPPQPVAVNTSILDIQPSELTEVFYKIEFKGVQKQKNYNEIIAKIKESNKQPIEEVQQQKEDPKKKAVAAKQQIEQLVVQEVLYDTNQNDYQIKSLIKDNVEQSESYPTQKYQALVEFVTERINIQVGNKTFNQYKPFDIITGVVVGWSNTQRVEIHSFAKPTKQSLPQYIQQTLMVLPPISNKKIELSIQEILVLYPIKCLAISQNSVHLALGLGQGSIYIYDLVLKQEKFYLDKHNNFVNFVQFCEDMRVMSTSYDGSVHLYDLSDGKVLCKRTNQFRKGTKVNVEEQKQGLWSVAQIGVSHSGIGVVVDQQGECRLYDIWHGEKIAKLSPLQIMDDKIRVWNTTTPIIRCYRNEILILSDTNEAKQVSIQIFKIFDNLVNLFPALNNVFRRGVEKEKIVNLFERISKTDLQNPYFEVPNLIGTDPNNLKVPGQDSKTNRQSIVQKKSVVIQNNLQSSGVSNRKSQQQQQQDATNQIQKMETISNKDSLINSLHKSTHSDQQIDFNSSFRSQNTSQKSNKNPKSLVQQYGLTKEMLHPEQYLLEKDKKSLPSLIKDDAEMVDHCRSRNSEKAVRIEKVNSMISKLGQKLSLEDDKRKLQERQKHLQKIK